MSDEVDPTFRFMTLDWDGRIRMDPSSPYAMQRLIALKDRFDVAFACDTDHDRHGIVARSAGLLPPNHYLAVVIDYLFRNRPRWRADAGVGKTVVSSAHDRPRRRGLGRTCTRSRSASSGSSTGLLDGSLGFGGEESAGASFLRLDGRSGRPTRTASRRRCSSAEITARTGRDPGEHYRRLHDELGDAGLRSHRRARHAAAEEAARGSSPAAAQARRELAGEPIVEVLTKAPRQRRTASAA